MAASNGARPGRAPRIRRAGRAAAALCALAVFPAAAGADDLVRLANEWVEVLVEKDTGRFMLKTVKGDPSVAGDDNVFLLYKDSPPTTFTTVALDDKNAYRFGSGDGKFVVKPIATAREITAVWRVDEVEVTQVLSFTNSPTSERADSLRVEYRVANRSARERRVGLRLLFDTALGDRDSAPFSIPGYGLIEDEQELAGDKVPQYWYSFDNIKDPKVRSMGTLKGATLAPPDRVVFAAWKRLSENIWTFKTDSGSSFKRSWLGSRDAAVGLWYASRPLSKEGSLVVATLYGMYGTASYRGATWSVVVGGSTFANDRDSFAVTADVRNVSPYELTNCVIRLKLPDEILPLVESAGNQSPTELKRDDIEKDELVPVVWSLRARTAAFGTHKYSVHVSGYYQGKLMEASVQRHIVINRATYDWTTNNQAPTNQVAIRKVTNLGPTNTSRSNDAWLRKTWTDRKPATNVALTNIARATNRRVVSDPSNRLLTIVMSNSDGSRRALTNSGPANGAKTNTFLGRKVKGGPSSFDPLLLRINRQQAKVRKLMDRLNVALAAAAKGDAKAYNSIQAQIDAIELKESLAELDALYKKLGLKLPADPGAGKTDDGKPKDAAKP